MNSLKNMRCLKHKRFTIKCLDCAEFKQDPERSIKEYFPNFIRIFEQNKDSDYNARCDLCNILLRVNRLSGIQDHLDSKSHLQLENEFWKKHEDPIKIDNFNTHQQPSNFSHGICIELKDSPEFFDLLEKIKRKTPFLEPTHQIDSAINSTERDKIRSNAKGIKKRRRRGFRLESRRKLKFLNLK